MNELIEPAAALSPELASFLKWVSAGIAANLTLVNSLRAIIDRLPSRIVPSWDEIPPVQLPSWYVVPPSLRGTYFPLVQVGAPAVLAIAQGLGRAATAGVPWWSALGEAGSVFAGAIALHITAKKGSRKIGLADATANAHPLIKVAAELVSIRPGNKEPPPKNPASVDADAQP